jgi:hypothetical protein
LFFEPATAPLSEGSAELWNDALAAGWSILLSGAGKGAGTGRDTITARIRSLRARVRERLFEATAPAVRADGGADPRKAEPALPARNPEPLAAEDENDAAISEILDAILRKWSAESAAAAAPAPPETKASPARPRTAPPASDDFQVKTVVLGAPSLPAPPPAAPLSASDPAPMPRAPLIPPAATPPPPAAPDDSIEKTMILRAGPAAPEPLRAPVPPPAPPPGADDFLDRTVILGPGKSGIVPPATKMPAAGKDPGHPSAADPEPGVDLEKTVIIKSPPDEGKIRRQGR